MISAFTLFISTAIDNLGYSGLPMVPRMSREKWRKTRRELIGFLILRLFLVVPPLFRVRRVFGGESLQAIKRLLYREYYRRRYVADSPEQMHFTRHAEQPGAASFGIFRREECWGTLSVAPDWSRGIAMAEAFPGEIESLRERGCTVAEFTLLALDGEKVGRHYSLNSVKKFFTLFSLFEAAYYYTRDELKVSDIVIVVNPRTRGIYDFIGFEQIGQVRSYSGARGKQGVAMRLSIRNFESGCSEFARIYCRKLDFRSRYYRLSPRQPGSIFGNLQDPIRHVPKERIA